MMSENSLKKKKKKEEADVSSMQNLSWDWLHNDHIIKPIHVTEATNK